MEGGSGWEEVVDERRGWKKGGSGWEEGVDGRKEYMGREEVDGRRKGVYGRRGFTPPPHPQIIVIYKYDFPLFIFLLLVYGNNF